MIEYVVRRLLIAVPVFMGITLVSFVFVRLLPGDPVRMLMDPHELQGPAAMEYIERRRAELGLDRPIPVQYVAWVREVSTGNLGYSYHRRIPVTEVVGNRLGPSLRLMGTGIMLALLVGVPIGIIAALRQNSIVDYLAAALSMFAISVPNFFLALVGIFVFALWLGILPSAGMESLIAEPSFGNRLRHLILPGGILSAVLLGPYVRYTRQGMLEVLRQDFIVAAKGRGVPWRVIVVRHALRNVWIPLVTVVAIQIPALLAGTVIIESIFTWPGIGKLVLDSITTRDYPVIMGLVMLTATAVLLLNLLADVIAAILDPRVRL